MPIFNTFMTTKSILIDKQLRTHCTPYLRRARELVLSTCGWWGGCHRMKKWMRGWERIYPTCGGCAGVSPRVGGGVGVELKN